MELTKRDVAEALGIETDAALARYFGITRSAVTQWGDDPIPEVRVLQLQVRDPVALARIQLKQESAKTGEVERAKERNNNDG